MAKLGTQTSRRDALVKATIAEVGRAGSLDVTVSQIARTAGMSPALAHHYFGAKEQIFDAAMRHILTLYGAQVRAELARADCPRARLAGIIRASFAPANFRADVIGAWLTFYVRAQTLSPAWRLLRVYQNRLRSNLIHDLRPLLADAPAAAETLAALIDGLYIRAALGEGAPDGPAAERLVVDCLDRLLERGR